MPNRALTLTSQCLKQIREKDTTDVMKYHTCEDCQYFEVIYQTLAQVFHHVSKR